MINLFKKLGLAACVVFAVFVIVGVGLVVVVLRHQSDAMPELSIRTGDCNVPQGSGSGNYSATITAVQNYDATVSALNNFLKQHQAEITNQNVSLQQYPTDVSNSKFIAVNSVAISGMIPFSDSDAFMADMQNAIGSSNTISNLYFSKTTADQLAQNCLDAENYAKVAKAMAISFSREIPGLIKSYNEDYKATSSSPSTDPGSYAASLYNQTQSFYNNMISQNDSITNSLQSLNKTSFNITVNDKAIPSISYPYSASTNSQTSNPLPQLAPPPMPPTAMPTMGGY